MTNLDPAIKHFGSLGNVAKAIGLKPMSATMWKKRGLPPERAVEIAAASNGALKPSELLPTFKWE